MPLACAKEPGPKPGRAGAAAAAAPSSAGEPSARVARVVGLVGAARVHLTSALARLVRGVGARAGALVCRGGVRVGRSIRAASVAGRGGAGTIHVGWAAAHRVALLALDHLPVAVAHAVVVRLAEVTAARGRRPVLVALVHRHGLAGLAALRCGLVVVGVLLRGGLAGVGVLLRRRLAGVIRAGVPVLRAGPGYGERPAEDRKCEDLHRCASIQECAFYK